MEKRINSRTKGQTGEREVCKMLNEILDEESKRFGIVLDSREYVQRNQIQSAVGGDDLTNTLCFSIEVKRAETLSIERWWKQCADSASRAGKIPILIYRQSRQPWRVVCLAKTGSMYNVRATIELDSFLLWFRKEANSHFNAYTEKEIKDMGSMP